MKADLMFDLAIAPFVIAAALVLAAPLLLSAEARREARMEEEGEDGVPTRSWFLVLRSWLRNRKAKFASRTSAPAAKNEVAP